MSVPNLPPAKPHSCKWSRLPRFQRAAAKPTNVTSAKKKTKTVKAVKFSGMTFLFLSRLRAVIDHGRDDHADDDPGELKPIEERKSEQCRLAAVVKRPL